MALGTDGFIQGHADTEVEFAAGCPGREKSGYTKRRDVGALGDFRQHAPRLVGGQAPEWHHDADSLVHDHVGGFVLP
ncbi:MULTISPECIES: hypothetical protein [unclassified Streptomyces]|uniref:hypothetical protein n=1 Tax=unclassified Streptomyces TaxID=2593676 RepID=UPI002255CB41|nr:MULTISPECIES: hypothetical protein [unclassified Streptomyces]MCX5134832.1 hypothetical protein [Streptomyces sp. NBC_00340]WSD75783.1 hypothetical protein OHB33_05405 [Streptomyces sp. NBC_01558]